MMDARAARALVFGIGLGAIFSVLALSPIGAAVEEAVSLPWLFRVRGAIEPPSDVVIVAIDKWSADHLGLFPHPHEWPRSHHARLIRELKARGAAAIIFDLKFERPRSAAEDDEFASAMRDFGRGVSRQGRDRQDNPIIGNIGSPIIDVSLQRKLEEAALGVAPNNSAFMQTVRRHFEQDFKAIRNNSLMRTSTSLEALIRLYEGPDNLSQFYGSPGNVPTISYFHALTFTFSAATPLPIRLIFAARAYSSVDPS